MDKIPFVDEKLIQNIYNLNKNIKVFSVFLGKNISYKIKTDGIVEEQEVRIDKWPQHREVLLTNHGTLKRCDFIISNANLVLIEKTISNTTIQDIYINADYFEMVHNQNEFIGLEIDFNEKEKIRVKTLKSNLWK
mgnify:CR=1 FL=1